MLILQTSEIITKRIIWSGASFQIDCVVDHRVGGVNTLGFLSLALGQNQNLTYDSIVYLVHQGISVDDENELEK